MTHLRSKSTLESLVPGADPIKLVSWYREFASYLPTCEMQTKRWMVRHIQPDWICIDAGANIGYHTILMARQAYLGEVHAFEPTKTFAMLEENIEYSGVSNVHTNQVALGATAGQKVERLHRIWGKAAERYSGGWTTIDSYVDVKQISRLDFVKIDVDGFDLEVLWGAKDTLKAHLPVVLVEITHALQSRQQTAADVFGLMTDLGYRHCIILDNENYLFSESTPANNEKDKGLFLVIDKEIAGREEGAIEEQREVVEWINRSGILASGAVRDSSDVISSSAPSWSYMVRLAGLKPVEENETLEVHVQVIRGSLGMFLSDRQAIKPLSREQIATEGEARISLKAGGLRNGSLVFRKTTAERTEFRILGVAKLRLKH